MCLNVGCIPSKALLHAAKVVEDAQEIMSEFGLNFAKPKIDAKKLRGWKRSVVKKLTGGLKMMAKQRQVEIVTGEGQFTGANEITVKNGQKEQTIQFEQAIIAAGSLPVKLPFIQDPRIVTSTGALELEGSDEEWLVLGGGIIGLEMATVYHALGAKITVVEMQNQLIPGADADLIQPLHKRIAKRYSNIMLKTRVTKVEAKKMVYG